jgi:putative tributyrin esterase
MIMLKNICLTVCLIFSISLLQAARVDSIEMNTAMNKKYKVAVVLPDSYENNKSVAYPVIYLLHGAWGHFGDWLTATPDKMTVKNLADQYQVIIATPEGETFGWYLDSPYNKENKFETHIIKEVIPTVDSKYRTVKDKKGRAIVGLSMGGHGAMYLSNRNPTVFCAAGSMSGALDMSGTLRGKNKDFVQVLTDLYIKHIGKADPDDELFVNSSIVNMVPVIKKNGLNILIDCGLDDTLIETNRELHRRLTYAGVNHDYIERPGGHTWDYWQNALPYQVLYMQKVFSGNGVAVK